MLIIKRNQIKKNSASLLCLALACLLFHNCTHISKPQTFDIQGHRGARGLFPENTIPSFIAAIENGATTLELDLALSADSLLVISHEPWLSPTICVDSTGSSLPITATETHNLYHMQYEDIEKFDCGSKEHPGFPDQMSISVTKPLFTDLLDTLKRSSIRIPINVELKTKPAWDKKYYPSVQFMAEQLMNVLSDYQYADVTTIQSFDTRAIQYIMTQSFPGNLALLVSADENPIDKLNQLPATPAILSPEHTMVDSELRRLTERKNMLLIPWTVNDTKRMSQLIELGVDGIITDYPDRLNNILKANN